LVNLDIEWYGAVQSVDRDGEIWIADRPLDGSGELGFAFLRLQQRCATDQKYERQPERDASATTRIRRPPRG
jgi:hypothetical protein